MNRLFLSLPDPHGLAWRLTDGRSGQAETATGLPAADEVWLVLPAGRVLLTRVQLSQRALKQLGEALGNALEDRLMLDPALVHIVLGRGGEADGQAVAVVERAWFDHLLAECRRRGVEPAGAIPDTLLWGDATTRQWVARWDGAEGFVRTGAAAGFTLDDGSSDLPPLALRLGLAEARKAGKAPDVLLLETRQQVDANAWSLALDCRVEMQELPADLHSPALNLLRGPYAPRRQGWWSGFLNAEQGARLRLAAGLAAAALGIHVLGTVADWARLSWEHKQLRAEMRLIFKETFPQTQAIVDPTLQMQRQLADLRRAHGFAESGDFLHILEAAGGQMGGAAGLTYEAGRLTLEQPRATDPEGLRRALTAKGYRMAQAEEGSSRAIHIERSGP